MEDSILDELLQEEAHIRNVILKDPLAFLRKGYENEVCDGWMGASTPGYVDGHLPAPTHVLEVIECNVFAGWESRETLTALVDCTDGRHRIAERTVWSSPGSYDYPPEGEDSFGYIELDAVKRLDRGIQRLSEMAHEAILREIGRTGVDSPQWLDFMDLQWFAGHLRYLVGSQEDHTSIKPYPRRKK